jgi:Tfp pilus assembly protein PilF
MAGTSRKQMIEEMLAADPGNAEMRYMLAMEHVSAADDAGAVRCFEQVIAADSSYQHAYHQAARALARLGEIGRALAMLHQGISAAQKKGDLHAAGEMSELLASLQ